MPSAQRKRREADKKKRAAEKEIQAIQGEPMNDFGLGSSAVSKRAGPSNQSEESDSNNASDKTPSRGRPKKKRFTNFKYVSNSPPTQSTQGAPIMGGCPYDANGNRLEGSQFLNFDSTDDEEIEENAEVTQDDRLCVEIPAEPQFKAPRGRPRRNVVAATPREQAPQRRSLRLSQLNTPIELTPITELQAKAKDYIEKHKPPTAKTLKLSGLRTQRCKNKHQYGCGSKQANHKIPYYDTGDFTEKCPYCEAKLLKSELDGMKQNKWGKCCAYGQVHTVAMDEEYKELMHPPKALKDLTLYEDPPKRTNLLKNTIPINNSMAFGSVTCGKADPNDRSVVGSRKDTCKLNGEFTFRMSDLFCREGQKPLFGQAYCLDPETACNLREENFARNGLPNHILPGIIATLEKMIRKHHPFATAFQTAGEMYKKHQDEGNVIPSFQLTILTNRELQEPILDLENRPDIHIIRNNEPAQKQVAVIWINDEGIAPEVNGIWLNGKEGRIVNLEDEDPNTDPACFPILFPRGTQGYRFGMQKVEDQRRKDKRNVLIPEEREQQAMDRVLEDINSEAFGLDTGDDTVVVRDVDTAEINPNEEADELDIMLNNPAPYKKRQMKNKVKGEPEKNISMRQFHRYRTFTRVQDKKMAVDKNHEFHWLWTMRKLAEYFLISVLNRVERNEMKFTKFNQQNLRHALSKDFIAALERGLPAGGTLGEVFFTPSSMQGSRQYYQQSYANLMTLCRKMGNPTWFVTFTGNPAWPEIAAAMPEGQEFTNRADIVCRIFINKAKAFVKDVTEQGCLGKVSGWCYSVEHQKRGMPHLHLLLILDKKAKGNEGLGTPEFVDQYVSARIPTLPPADDASEEAEQKRRLWDLVTKMNLHDCDNNAPCRYERIDKDGLTKSMCNKRFPKDYSAQTVLSAVRYTQYKRRQPQEELNPTAEEINADLDPDNRENYNSETPLRIYNDQGFEEIVNEDINPDNDPDNSTQYRRLPPANTGAMQSEDEVGSTFYKMKGGKKIRLTDQHVIGYNEYLTLKYGCHINIEYVFGQKACKYIFKYILKGHEQAYVKVGRSEEGQDRYDFDEIAATFKVRYMTSMEAYLRLFGYPIVHNSHTFATMPVVIPETESVVFEEGREGDALALIGRKNKVSGFFELCSQEDEDGQIARQFRYDEIEYQFWWDKANKKWVRRQRAVDNKLLIRVYTVSPKNIQLYAARALLLHKKGPQSYEDLCTVPAFGDQPTETCRDADGNLDYNAAAKKLNLLGDEHNLMDVLHDAAAHNMNGRRLQNYFAALIYHQTPSNAQAIFDAFLDEMFTPRPNQPSPEVEREYRKQKVLNNIEYYLRRFGTECARVGLDTPKFYNHEEMERQIDDYELLNIARGDRDAANPWKKLADDNLQKMADNPEQKQAYDTIMEALNLDGTNPGANKLFFLEGAGGCGKTFLYNTLIARMRQNNKKVVACASTAIAALLLIGGKTAHRAFRIPTNGLDRKTPPKFPYEKNDAQNLRDTKLIIIDEVSMLHKDILDFIDRTLRSIMPVDHPDKDVPFGGKTVILGGDWKQLLPVVPGGNRQDQIQASLKHEEVYKKFKTLRLTKNMRADRDQLEFCEWLKLVGASKNTDARGEIAFKKENMADSINELIDFTFKDLFNNPLEEGKSDLICDAAILAPRNDGVNEINVEAMKRMPGEETVFESIDHPLPSEDARDAFDVYAADFNIEAVHEDTPSGLPPHRLALKVGAPIMIIRNINVDRGLCNGTRLQIIKMTKHNLICKVLTGPNRGQTEFIHKMTIKYGEDKNHRGLRYMRYQFPVRPCFAMTVNKAQGQTLKRVGLALNRQQCFAHGQVYVAASRVTRMEGIRLFSTTASAPGRVKNIVYKEVLEQGDR